MSEYRAPKSLGDYRFPTAYSPVLSLAVQVRPQLVSNTFAGILHRQTTPTYTSAIGGEVIALLAPPRYSLMLVFARAGDRGRRKLGAVCVAEEAGVAIGFGTPALDGYVARATL